VARPEQKPCTPCQARARARAEAQAAREAAAGKAAEPETKTYTEHDPLRPPWAGRTQKP
jgi:hypothetical protein